MSGNEEQAVAKGFEETQRERALTDGALLLAGKVPVPSDLQLRLKLALSHERVRAQRRWNGRLLHGIEGWYNRTLRPAGVQVAVAAASVLLVLSGFAMLGAVSPQQAVEANDLPLAGFSAPHLMYSNSDEPVASIDEQALVVDAQINRDGKVFRYRVLEGKLDADGEARLRARMLSSTFEPARVFGEPVRGHVVLTFADVMVRG